MTEGFCFGGIKITSLLYADDIILLASSVGGFQLSLDCFAAECEVAGMRIGTSESGEREIDR